MTTDRPGRVSSCPSCGHAWADHGQSNDGPVAYCRRDDCGCLVKMRPGSRDHMDAPARVPPS